MSAAHSREVEIKLHLPGAAEGRRLLAGNGFRTARRRAFESNVVFDTKSRGLRRAASLLRLRAYGRLHTVTFKGRPEPGRHKSREELELEVSDPAAFTAILNRLGFEPVFRYEKYRTEYAGPEPGGVVTLDETPIGCFLELEGRPGWIDRTARRLGYSEEDYITASYADLYRKYHQKYPATPANMVFPAAARRG